MPLLPHRSGLGLRFLALLIPVFAGVLSLAYGLYSLEAERTERRVRDREVIRVSALVQIFQGDLRAAIDDLSTLTTGDGLQAFLERGLSVDLERARKRAAFFGRMHPEYESLRYLGEDGRELIRIDRGGLPANAAALRSDAGEAYFQAARSLPPSVLFISRLTSRPPSDPGDSGSKNWLHFVAPVADSAGTRRGFYVIDYRGEELIAHLERLSPTLHHPLRLLTPGGEILSATPPVIAHRTTLPWSTALRTPEGQAPLAGGVLTWRRITPRDFAEAGGTTVQTGDAYLVLASEVPAAEWTQLLAATRRTYFLVTPLALLAAVGGLWLYTSQRRARRSLLHSEEKLAVTLDSIGDAVLAIDVAGRVTRMNPVAEQLTGWDLASAQGRPVTEIFRPLDEVSRQPLPSPEVEVLGEGGVPPPVRSSLLLARDGSERPIAARASPIREPGGPIVGVVLVFRDVSAEHDRDRMQARFAALIESSDDAILTKDFDGTITSWNPAAAELFGYTASEAIGQPISLIVPAERHEEEVHLLARIAEGATFGQLESVRLRKGRPPVPVAVTLSPLRDRAGRVTGVSAIIRDITRQQLAAEQLRQSADEIRSLYNHAPCGYHSLDADGVITAMNDTELGWLGYRREEVVGRVRLSTLLAPESRPTFQATFPRFKRDGVIHDLELRLLRRDGTSFDALINATGVFDSDGRFIASRSSVFDITARKAAEQQLDRFFGLSLDFLCISSADGFFKRVSPAVTDMLGWTVAEFLASPYLDFVHPDDLPATLREIERQVVRGEKVLQFENRYRHKDGSWRILSWRSIPQPDGLMYATARDVTDLRRDEQEVLRLNTELRQHAARLEYANKELESFSYSVSHDLRAPLRHVQGYVELLTREAQAGLSEKSLRFLKTISDSAREMGQLIDDLLKFSRMGRTELHAAPVAPNSFLAGLCREFEFASPGRALVWKIAPLPSVQGDAAMLRQVFANLLDNAVKYTRGRDPAVIEIGTAGEEDGRLIFFVRDNGAGFDPRYAGKLFGVFQRLHRADEFEGTGIGLASVQRIIARHDGRIWADARPGAGATFFFTLQPAVSAAPNPSA